MANRVLIVEGGQPHDHARDDRMRRREFLTLLGGAAVGWPLSGSAQTQPKIARVGVVSSATATYKPASEAFRQGLRELGYVEGETIVLEVRSAEGRFERIPELVAELLRLKVDVLVAVGSPAVLEAKNATQTIPIVMVATDPVGLGLVGSLSRPGGNVTGLSYLSEEIIAKRLQLLKELVPRLARVGVLKNPMVPSHPTYWKEIEVAAQKLGVALEALEVRGPEDFDAVFATAKEHNAQALLAFDDGLTMTYRSRITALAAGSHLPVMYPFREFPDTGGLMSYGASVVHVFRLAATFVDKILKGAKPADLPVEQPTKFELVINVGVAKALGLAIPQSLQLRADEVIE
jgi:putative ABC transport system substrate-binding protein